MAQNFLRVVQVAVSGGPTISGGGATDLRIKGAVRQWGGQTPNMASISVQNPDPK